MSHTGRFPSYLLLVCAILLALPLAATPAFATAVSKYAGVYNSDALKPGASKPGEPATDLSLSLGEDGSATLTEDYGKGPATLFGRWADSGSQITVTFSPVAGQPTEPPMTFEPSHDGLQATIWNRAEWGKLTPPLLKKESSNWHNKGKHGIF